MKQNTTNTQHRTEPHVDIKTGDTGRPARYRRHSERSGSDPGNLAARSYWRCRIPCQIPLFARNVGGPARETMMRATPEHTITQRRRPTALSCAVLLICTLSAGSAHAEMPARPIPRADYELTSRWHDAVERGRAWLADQQAPDGAFGAQSHYGKHVGITGIAGLAFMAGGDTPGRGKYGENVEGCVRFILAHRSESGLLAAETSHGPMYGHGFATLFLAEVYGMSHQSELRETLHRAVRLIVATQNDKGGWRYQPVRSDADISVTVCQIMALRAARNVGVFVEKSVIDRAITYVRNSQNPDGGFRYMRSSGGSAFARSAAGVAALQYAGIYGGDEIERGLDYVMRFKPPREHSVGHFYYGQYYAVQAMYFAGSDYWQQWWPAVRDELLDRRESDGSWRGQAGSEYGTAMALIVLQMPNRLLPIFQK